MKTSSTRIGVGVVCFSIICALSGFSSFALELKPRFDVELSSKLSKSIEERTVSIRVVHLDEDRIVDQYSSGMGTLLNEKWVLTSGHLFQDFHQVLVFVQGMRKNVKKLVFFTHPTKSKGINDFALLELEESVSGVIPTELSVLESKTGPFIVSGYDSEEFASRPNVIEPGEKAAEDGVAERSVEEESGLDSLPALKNDVIKKQGVVGQLFDRFAGFDLNQDVDHSGLFMSTRGIDGELDTYFSNCDLQEGDSGGGLFNAEGKLVGVSSRSSVFDLEPRDDSRADLVELKMSFWIPLDSFRKAWIEAVISREL
jgi:hypothetical protein